MPNRIFPIGHPDSSDPTSHFLTLREGAEMVRDLHEHAAPHTLKPFKHIRFHKLALQAVMNQEGAEGMQWSLAVKGDALTLVGFAVNANGDIIGPMVVDNGHPCPPLC